MLTLMNLSKKARGNGHALDDLSVRDLLQNTGQTEDAVAKFWEPLALATLNESLDIASARLFAEVLRRALLSKKSDSNLAISKVGLSDLFATPMQQYLEGHGVPLSFNTQATRVTREGAGFLVETNTGERFATDQLLLATPPNALAKLLAESGSEFQGLFPELVRFGSAPIVSINLWFENFHPPQRMLGLVNSPIHWVFDKSKILTGQRSSHLTLVVSGAHALAQENKENLVKLACAELQRFFPELENARLYHSQVVKELEATFSAQRGLNRYRPSNRTALPGLYLAGDWTDTGLPATIESAVLSGHQAADALLESHHAR
ncbi:MAG: FAD-dependent oxidoreductase [Deltaproteobacteria bacterium]|nr:FAD-dependent oxidoreductase [Deltaproteobacteria bacterium]